MGRTRFLDRIFKMACSTEQGLPDRINVPSP
jgi:hypothetical protein